MSMVNLMERKDEQMAVFRVNKNKNYTVMCNQHFQNRSMSLKAKGLLSLMLSLPDDWDYSAEGLQELSSDGRESLQAAVRELKEFGYLKITRQQLDGGKFSYIYDIYESPDLNGSPSTGLPSTVSRTTDNRITVNRQRETSSNKVLSTKYEVQNTNDKIRSCCSPIDSESTPPPEITSSGSSYENIIPCDTPTDQDIQLIIKTWNGQQLTQKIDRITPLSQVWNDTQLCIRNNLPAFLEAIRGIDAQGWYQKRFKEEGKPVRYKEFVNPGNYDEYCQGHYKEWYGKKEEKHGSFWD